MFKIEKKQIIAGALALALSVVAAFTGVMGASAAEREALFPKLLSHPDIDNYFSMVSGSNNVFKFAPEDEKFDYWGFPDGKSNKIIWIGARKDLLKTYKMVVGGEKMGYSPICENTATVQDYGFENAVIGEQIDTFYDTMGEALQESENIDEIADLVLWMNPRGISSKSEYHDWVHSYNIYLIDASGNIAYTIPLPEIICYTGANYESENSYVSNATPDVQTTADAQAAIDAQAALEAQAAQDAQLQVEAQAQAVTTQATTETNVQAVSQGTYTVEANDNLCKIAQKVYGDMKAWREIYKANPVIKDDYIIYKGQVLIIPVK